MIFGIYDTVDRVWIGDDDGPKLFHGGQRVGTSVLTDDDAEFFARCAAEVIDIQLDYPPKRHVTLRYRHGRLTLHDEVATKRTPAEALKGKLSGEYL